MSASNQPDRVLLYSAVVSIPSVMSVTVNFVVTRA